MKKVIALILCVVFLTMAVGCGSAKTIEGEYCDTYGLLNRDLKCENVRYKTVVGNVIWGVLLFETVIAPVYFFGFSLYEPVGVKKIDGI